MIEFIAFRQIIPISIPALKKELLFFDKICLRPNALNEYIGITNIMHKYKPENDDFYKFFIQELEWLYDNNLVFEPDKKQLRKYINTLDRDDAFNKLICTYKFFEKKIDNNLSCAISASQRRKRTYLKHDALSVFLNIIELESLYIRILSPVIEKIYNCHLVPYISFTKLPDLFQDKKKADIIHVILKEFPVPSNSTPWEQILEFKSDEDSQYKLRPCQVLFANWPP